MPEAESEDSFLYKGLTASFDLCLDESSIFQETVPGKSLDSMCIGKLLGGLI